MSGPSELDLTDTSVYSEVPVDGFSILVLESKAFSSFTNCNIFIGYHGDEFDAHVVVYLRVNSGHLNCTVCLLTLS